MSKLSHQRSVNVRQVAERYGTPMQWLTLGPGRRYFNYTDYGQAELQRSYIEGGGCPVIEMDVIREDGLKTNLSMEYWNTSVLGQLSPDNSGEFYNLSV